MLEVAAGQGDPLTLVCTDVEGSTELWEWDRDAMLQVKALACVDDLDMQTRRQAVMQTCEWRRSQTLHCHTSSAYACTPHAMRLVRP